jgi:hypothetical protein
MEQYIAPRRLTETEYKAMLGDRMINILGLETTIHKEGVLDLTPYLVSVEKEIAPLQLLPDVPPSAVYHSVELDIDHVLYPCDRSNTYLVIVVSQKAGTVHGHYILDLAHEFGLRDT